MPGIPKTKIDPTTEEKIKDAARRIFMKKGYAATRTRDIAEEAGLNLALLNYYFRSKEKLFDIIMLENLQHFISGIRSIIVDETTPLDEKISALAGSYIDMLIKQPDLPLFIFSEIRANPKKLVAKMGIKEVMMKSSLMKQLQDVAKSNKAGAVHPLQLFVNVVGMIVFPFIASPLLQNLGNISQDDFNTLMLERKTLIPQWVKLMTKRTN